MVGTPQVVVGGVGVGRQVRYNWQQAAVMGQAAKMVNGVKNGGNETTNTEQGGTG